MNGFYIEYSHREVHMCAQFLCSCLPQKEKQLSKFFYILSNQLENKTIRILPQTTKLTLVSILHI